MYQIDGVLSCPACAGAVTAWQGHRFPLFEVDAFDPYQIHRCSPLVLATLRQARAMERLADETAERNALRAAMNMPVRLPEPEQRPARRLALVGPTKAAEPKQALTPLVDEMDY